MQKILAESSVYMNARFSEMRLLRLRKNQKSCTRDWLAYTFWRLSVGVKFKIRNNRLSGEWSSATSKKFSLYLGSLHLEPQFW